MMHSKGLETEVMRFLRRPRILYGLIWVMWVLKISELPNKKLRRCRSYSEERGGMKLAVGIIFKNDTMEPPILR